MCLGKDNAGSAASGCPGQAVCVFVCFAASFQEVWWAFLLLPFRKRGGLLFIHCEKIHSVVHSASEIMLWGNLSGKAAEGTHKINVKGPGANTNHN